MKILSLDNYISEKKSISLLTVKQIKDFDFYKYHPKIKDELREIIFNRMKKEGNKCDLNDIDVSNITDMSYLFSNLDENGMHISRNIISGRRIRKNNISEFNGDISGWDVSNVKDMSFMFCYAESFDGDISEWDVSKVEDMSYMFYYAKSFKGDISKWNVSNVKQMTYMFYGAHSFE